MNPQGDNTMTPELANLVPSVQTALAKLGLLNPEALEQIADTLAGAAFRQRVAAYRLVRRTLRVGGVEAALRAVRRLKPPACGETDPAAGVAELNSLADIVRAAIRHPETTRKVQGELEALVIGVSAGMSLGEFLEAESAVAWVTEHVTDSGHGSGEVEI